MRNRNRGRYTLFEFIIYVIYLYPYIIYIYTAHNLLILTNNTKHLSKHLKLTNSKLTITTN